MRYICLLAFLLLLTSAAFAGDPACQKAKQYGPPAPQTNRQPMRDFDHIYVNPRFSPESCLTMRVLKEVKDGPGVDTGQYFTQTTCTHPQQLVIDRAEHVRVPVMKPEVIQTSQPDPGK